MAPRSTLSFREFHEQHFSPASRTSFFEAVSEADQDPEEDASSQDTSVDEVRLPLHVQHLRNWLKERQSPLQQRQQYQYQHQCQPQQQEHYDPYWMYGYPQTFGWPADHSDHPPRASYSSISPHTYPLQTANGDQTVYDDDEEGEGEEPDLVPMRDDAGLQEIALSKEAIAIFEFSRQFREQKAAAAKLEKDKARKLRSKQRRTAMMGFALSAMLSDEDESLEKDGAEDGHSRSAKRRKRDDVSSDDIEEEEDASEGSDDDTNPFVKEPSATDTSFLSVPIAYRQRLQDKLYGGNLKSLESPSQHHDRSPPPDVEEVVQRNKMAINELMQIQYLESLLDRTYEDSLQPQTLGAGDGPVALWPGMPLRC